MWFVDGVGGRVVFLVFSLKFRISFLKNDETILKWDEVILKCGSRHQ